MAADPDTPHCAQIRHHWSRPEAVVLLEQSIARLDELVATRGVPVLDLDQRRDVSQAETHLHEFGVFGPPTPQVLPHIADGPHARGDRRVGGLQLLALLGVEPGQLGVRRLKQPRVVRGGFLVSPSLLEVLIEPRADHQQGAEGDERDGHPILGHREQHPAHHQRRDHRQPGEASAFDLGGRLGQRQLPRPAPPEHPRRTDEVDIGRGGVDGAGELHGDHVVAEGHQIPRLHGDPLDPDAAHDHAVGGVRVDHLDAVPDLDARVPLGDERVGQLDVTVGGAANRGRAHRQRNLDAGVRAGHHAEQRHRLSAVGGAPRGEPHVHDRPGDQARVDHGLRRRQGTRPPVRIGDLQRQPALFGQGRVRARPLGQHPGDVAGGRGGVRRDLEVDRRGAGRPVGDAQFHEDAPSGSG